MERVLGPVDRINPESFTVEFEGETFIVEVWPNGDEVDCIADMYDEYDVLRVCFCKLVSRADVTKKGGV